MTFIVPYSHADGLQYWTPAGSPRPVAVVYKVPYYFIRVEGGGEYKAVRFGLQNKGTLPPPATRPCDAGLSSPRVCNPTWVPGYSPHSFPGSSRAGAWRLLPGKGFLVHEGANTLLGQVGGSLGCVEILDGRWNEFLGEIERIGKSTCSDIGSKGKLKVTIEAASYPVATLKT
ncbi:MAG: hypothetical protein HYY17_14345 [Planctomycetes bacterium]|nr:hypothetical protein [Planctomycetota bacterium]